MSCKRILIIIMRSNGDVFLSLPLITTLKQRFPEAKIDLLVFRNTLETAEALHQAGHIYVHDYDGKKQGKVYYLLQQLRLLCTLFKQYDLSISLTASDRSNFYAFLSGRRSIGAYDSDFQTSWWKRLLLTQSYLFDQNDHIVRNNVQPLRLLGISPEHISVKCLPSAEARKKAANLLNDRNIREFLIFHPSTQYEYKVYPRELRNQLLEHLNSLGIPVIITGGKTPLDQRISSEIPPLENIYNLIGKTSIEEYMALAHFALAYIGMDTLNMHIAASQDIRIFAIFGPTLIHRWSPWSNMAGTAASGSKPVQHYGNVTVFQADMKCVPCGLQGCLDDFGRSECLYRISPTLIFEEVRKYLEEEKNR